MTNGESVDVAARIEDYEEVIWRDHEGLRCHRFVHKDDVAAVLLASSDALAAERSLREAAEGRLREAESSLTELAPLQACATRCDLNRVSRESFVAEHARALRAEAAEDAARADLRLATEQGDRYLAEKKEANVERWDAIRDRDAARADLATAQAEVERLRAQVNAKQSWIDGAKVDLQARDEVTGEDES